MEWKSDIVYQLKNHKYQSNVYNEIIEHYNRLLENNCILQIQCIKLGNDVHHLRLANAGLEKASEASQELANANNKLTVANEEVIMHLREKGELAREVLRLNHELKEVLRDEFLAVQIQLDQLQADYTRIKPTFLELQQQLETEKRINQQLENQLIESKKIQLEMLDAEVKRYDKQNVQRRRSSTIEEDRISISSSKNLSDSNGTDMTQITSSDELLIRQRKDTTNSGNIFSSFKKIFAPGAININDSFNRTSTFCVSASIPTHEVTQWDCTDLEVYALQFQPSGSLLATGGSDKMVHLWEISSSGQPRKYSSLHGSHGAINALDFDNEGARLLVGCSGDKAFIWAYTNNQMPKDIYTGHSGLIYTCKFITGTKFATGSADRLIKIWDLYSRQCTRTLPAGSKCHDLVVTDASGTIISGHFDKKIRIWDTFTDTCRKELQFNAAITSLSYNAEKQQLLACLKDDTLKLIDLRQNNTIYSFSHDHFQVSTDTTKAILSPDGRYACAGSQDGSLFIWNTTNGICENVLNKKHSTMVTSVAWHPEGKYVASCEKHRRVILWSD